MAAIQGIEIALRNQISRELWDFAFTYPSFTSVLASLDRYYAKQFGSGSTRFTRSSDVSGSTMQVDFRASLPTVSGANAVTGSLASLVLPEQSGFSVIAGEMVWSHYQLREDVRRAYLDHIDKDPESVVPYIREVATAARDAVVSKLNTDIFPSSAVSTSVGAPAEDQIMALAYPLQNPGSAYSYLGIDLNNASYADLRAIVKDYSAGGSQLTPELIRKDILLPLGYRQAKPDLVVCDSTIYSDIVGQAEARVVIEQADTLSYGGQLTRSMGMYWLPESRLDAFTDNREVYFLDSGTWEFRQKGAFKEFSVKDHPDTATLLTMLGYFACGLICKSPRRNCRVIDAIAG